MRHNGEIIEASAANLALEGMFVTDEEKQIAKECLEGKLVFEDMYNELEQQFHEKHRKSREEGDGGDTIYCYAGEHILENKLNIHDDDKLEEYERKLTFLKGIELDLNPFDGDLDLDYVRKIHEFLFDCEYDWAGEIRKVDISKGNIFCLHELIQVNSDALFKELKNENYLFDLGNGEFIDRMAYYFGELNAIHPFREGNGRTQRIFFRELAKRNGYLLNFSSITQKETIKASVDSFQHEYDSLKTILAKSLKKERCRRFLTGRN